MKKYYLILLGVVAAYALITFSIPPDPDALEKYNLTESESRLLSATIVIPVALIWFASFYGFGLFKEYSTKIIKRPDGEALNKVANGLIILGLGSAVLAVLTALLRYYERENEGLTPTAVILSNYLSLIVYLAAFILIYKGSQALLKTLKDNAKPANLARSLAPVLLLSAVYVVSVFNDPSRQSPSGEVERASYYLPDWLIGVSIVLPYVVMWIVGTLAVHNLMHYQKYVQGILYKNALRYLSFGLATVIVTSILLHILTAFSGIFAGWGLGSLLAFIYALLLIIALGYLLIAKGAKQLKRMEEI